MGETIRRELDGAGGARPALAVCLLSVGSCGELLTATRSPVILVIERIGAARGDATRILFRRCSSPMSNAVARQGVCLKILPG